jgi:enoyl-[acyl-carrier protein] reductase II
MTIKGEHFSSISRRRLQQLLGGGGIAVALSMPKKAAALVDGAAQQAPSLSTRLTAEYGVQFPFVGAGMGFVSMPALVAAVSNAGSNS